MGQITGNVQRIASKPAGRGTAYNVQMDDGSWYGYGFNRPQFAEGATITFDVEYRGQYANIVVASVEILGGGQQQQHQQQGRAPRQPRAAAGGGMSKEQYWDNKEKRDLRVQRQIQHQSSRNSAIELVKVALANSAVALPSKKADQFDAIMALVDEMTDRYDEATIAVGQGKQRQHQAQQEPQQQDEGVDFDDDLPF